MINNTNILPGMIGQQLDAGSGGCASITNTTTTYINGAGTVLHYVPVTGYYRYGLNVWLMTASELGSAKQFTGLELSKAYNEPSGMTHLNQTLKMYHTTASVLPSTINTSGTFGSSLTLTGANAGLTVSDETTVLDGSFYHSAGQGWKTMTFGSNFCYNGTDNVVFMWVNNAGYYDTSNYPYWDTDSTSASSQRGGNDFSDSSGMTSVSRANVRPHLKLKY